MTQIQHLQLVLIDGLSALRTMYATHQPLPDTLNYCLRKAQAEILWQPATATSSLEPWQQSVLHTLPTELRSVGLPAAALCWSGEGGAVRAGTWMRIQLVHFAAGMNDVSILTPHAVSDDHVQQLMSALQPLLSLAEFELHRSAAGNWYVWSEAELKVQTRSIHSGIATRSYDVMPTGEDAAPLRRLLTEIQMLLHQHPVNLQREQQGLLPLNAVWFDGSGSITPASAGVLQRIMSNEAYVNGLCAQLNTSCWPVPHNATELLQLRDTDMVLVMRIVDLAIFDATWLLPVVRAVYANHIQQLTIHLDHLSLALRGGRWQQLQRWVARGSNIKELLA